MARQRLDGEEVREAQEVGRPPFAKQAAGEVAGAGLFGEPVQAPGYGGRRETALEHPARIPNWTEEGAAPGSP